MKNIFKKILLNTVAIALVAAVLPGLSYAGQIKTLIFAAIVLAVLNAFLAPVLKILMLPINVLTLGIAGWFINIALIYLTTLLVAGFTVTDFTVTLFGVAIIFTGFWAYLLVAFLLNLATGFISWILD